MQYIAYKRFKQDAICGHVNIPAMTPCELVDGLITYEGKPLCLAASENGHQYFTRDDDGQGMLRGKYIHAVQELLKKRDDDYQNRWDKIWEDADCQKYKRPEHEDRWLWNHEFFIAPIKDLQHIANLIGIKETNL